MSFMSFMSMPLAWLYPIFLAPHQAPSSQATSLKDTSIILHKSPHNLQVSIHKLQATLKKYQIPIFCQIDHGKNAAEVQETLAGNYLVIFGNPKVGTKLMQEDPVIGLELPLKILVFARAEQVYFAYKNPQSLSAKYQVNSKNIVNKTEQLMRRIITEALQK